MKCIKDRPTPAGGVWRGCYSGGACRDWGYCRERNIEAGGMKNVTPAMQAEWRKLDNPEP
jgi:hypothetical protein